MEEPEIKSNPQLDANSLQEQLDSLRQMMTSVLVLLLLVSGTLTIFLVRQWRFVQRDLEALRPQAAPVIAEYNKGLPAMQDFLTKLAQYGKTHADFAPIAAKYHLNDMVPKSGTNAPAAGSKK
jgi:hypothetical protein